MDAIPNDPGQALRALLAGAQRAQQQQHLGPGSCSGESSAARERLPAHGGERVSEGPGSQGKEPFATYWCCADGVLLALGGKSCLEGRRAREGGCSQGPLLPGNSILTGWNEGRCSEGVLLGACTVPREQGPEGVHRAAQQALARATTFNWCMLRSRTSPIRWWPPGAWAPEGPSLQQRWTNTIKPQELL